MVLVTQPSILYLYYNSLRQVDAKISEYKMDTTQHPSFIITK